MLKHFFFKHMLKSKMKDVPAAEQEKVLAAVEKNPQFFEEVAKEIQAKMKEGKDQMTAAMEVMQERGDELRKLM